MKSTLKSIKFWIALGLLCHCFGGGLWAQDSNDDENNQRISASLEIGGGTFWGDFRQHLERDGAFLFTPALDFALRVPLGNYWGLEGLIGSLSVIHPSSKPLEGTILYQGLGLWARVFLDTWQIRGGFGLGFQHCTLTLGPYSSGYLEGSLGLVIPISQAKGFSMSLRLRNGIFPNIQIPALFNLEKIDEIQTVSFTVGLTAN